MTEQNKQSDTPAPAQHMLCWEQNESGWTAAANNGLYTILSVLPGYKLFTPDSAGKARLFIGLTEAKYAAQAHHDSRPTETNVTGEPTGYLVKRYDLDGVLLDTELSFTKPVIRSTSKTEFVPLFASPAPQDQMEGWTKVPDEPTLDFLKSVNADNQVLAYENGRYYNAWFEFEPSEGGWFWTDDADSEPNPSHYMLLPDEPDTTEERT